MHIDSTMEDVKVEDAISNFFGEEIATKIKMSLKRQPFRGTQMAYVTLEEVREFRLLKVAHV